MTSFCARRICVETARDLNSKKVCAEAKNNHRAGARYLNLHVCKKHKVDGAGTTRFPYEYLYHTLGS
jgi:hypothetical protein